MVPELVRDSKALFFAEIANTLFGLGIVVILSRDLGAELFGLWVSVFSVFQIASMLNFGFPTIIVREGAKSVEELGGILSLFRRAQAYLSILIIPFCVSITVLLYGKNMESMEIIFVGFAFVCAVLQQINRAGLRVIGQAPREVAITFLDRGSVFILLVLVSLMNLESLVYYIIAYNFGPFLGLLYSIKIINKSVPKDVGSKFQLFEILRMSAPFGAGLIARPIRDGALKVILSVLGGFTAVAIFEIAWKAYIAGSSVSNAIRKSMLPVFSRSASSSYDLGLAMNHGYRVSKWVIQFGIFLGALSSLLIPEIFSNQYIESRDVFLLLLPSWSILVICSTWIVAVESIMEGVKFARIMINQAILTILVSLVYSMLTNQEFLHSLLVGIFVGEVYVSWQSYDMIRKIMSPGIPIGELFFSITFCIILCACYSVSIMIVSFELMAVTISANVFWMWKSKWSIKIPKIEPSGAGEI